LALLNYNGEHGRLPPAITRDGGDTLGPDW
jgi:hypothetical protein